VQEQEDTDLLDTNFTSLYKSLKQPGKLPKTMSENLSVPLAFIGSPCSSPLVCWHYLAV